MKLVISLPTRSRPEKLLNTLARSTANLVLSNTVVMVQVDDDDKETIQALSTSPMDSRVHVNVAPREDTIAEKWNRALKEPADAYLVSADDAPEVTSGYDALLLDAAKLFPDGIGMVYGHMANASFSSMVCPTARFVEKLGHIFPELFPYWFVDHWTDDVAKLIGRVAFADVRTDQSGQGRTQEMREPGWWATFFDAAYRMRRSIARQILDNDDLQTPSWQKEILRRSAPLIEYRSRWINDHVRAQARQLESWSGLSNNNDRYQRLRAKAAAMIPHLLDDFDMPAEQAKIFRNILIPPTQIASLPRAYAPMVNAVASPSFAEVQKAGAAA